MTSRLRGMCSTTLLQSLPDNGALEIDSNVRFSCQRLKILILKHPMLKIKAYKVWIRNINFDLIVFLIFFPI